MNKNDNIMITGGNSMIGRHLTSILKNQGYTNVFPITHQEYDLLSVKDTDDAFFAIQPKYVFNLAGFNGNISFSQQYPADIFYRTTTIALNTLNMCQKYRVQKVVNILSSCAIADLGDKKLKAEELWNGPPNQSIEAHGFAKRIFDAYSRQLYKQFGLLSVSAIVNNCYGEYDNTNLEKTKAVMGIIKRVVDAKNNNLPFIECWGTGAVYREFVYAGDAAASLIDVMENYNNPHCPINISTEDEISIYDLTYKIVDIVGYTGKVIWDNSRPDGQKRKSLDISNMREFVKHKFVNIDEGLKNTVQWYEESKKCVAV